MKILSESGQEVPDFLQGDMSTGGAVGGGTFGGKDIRNNQAQVDANDDEGW